MNESQSSQKGGAANKKAKVDLTLGGVVKLAMSFVMDVMDNAKLDFLTRVHATDANRTPQSASDFARPETL